MADDDDDDIKPVKKKVALKPRTKSAPPRFLVAARIVKLLSLAVGAFIAIVGWMSIVGLVVDFTPVRLGVALVPTFGLGLLLVDRVLKRFTVDDRGVAILDVFAVFFMAQALAFVLLGGVTHNAFTKEADRYARSGSRGLARAVYLLGGKSPTFDEMPAGGTPATGASGDGGAPAPSSSSAPGKAR